MLSNLVLKWNNSDLKEVFCSFEWKQCRGMRPGSKTVEREHQKRRFPLASLGNSTFKKYSHPSYPSTFPGDSWRFGPWVCISHRKYKKFWDRRASKCLKCCCPIQISQSHATPPPSNYTLLATLSIGEFANKVFWLGVLPHGLNLGFCYYERMG